MNMRMRTNKRRNRWADTHRLAIESQERRVLKRFWICKERKEGKWTEEGSLRADEVILCRYLVS